MKKWALEKVKKQREKEKSGIGEFLLFLLGSFFLLKIVGLIHWSWWWVFSPIWIPIVLFGIILAVFSYMTKKDDDPKN